MAGQSLLMGESFGKGFQYGKRKISAMSNEDFNKMTAADLGQEIATDYTAIIPSLEEAVRASTAFQRMIFQEMGEILKLIPSEILKFFGLESLLGSEEDRSKLSFNVLQVRAWSDTELRAAFENSLHLYDGITQINITDEYNKRFVLTEPQPHVHEPSHHPPVITKDRAWYKINATGRVVEKPGGAVLARDGWGWETNVNGEWRSGIIYLSISQAITGALSAWPPDNYVQFGFTDPTEIYWTLKSKL